LPLVAPLALYLGWKWVHFGGLLPASFYVKAGHTGWFSYLGLQSVSCFLSGSRVFIALALVSLAVRPAAGRPEAIAFVFAACLSVFYLRVDTLMDAGGRFLYPAGVFVWYLAAPALCAAIQPVLRWRTAGLVRVFTAGAAFLLISHYDVWGYYVTVRQALNGADRLADKQELMQKEYAVALKLTQYPHIRNVLIAFSDAGVIPYVTQAPFLDVVGLNDLTISREKDLRKLVDYFFMRKPVLVIHPANRNHTWISYDHGPLGNYTLWSADPRWDGYAYAGTVTTSGEYDMHLLLRKDYTDFAGFAEFLRRQIADRCYDPFPLSLGTRTAPGSAHE
jgi:hypothetical protein